MRRKCGANVSRNRETSATDRKHTVCGGTGGRKGFLNRVF